MIAAEMGLAMQREATVPSASQELRELYERHSRSVYLTALRVTGSPADAEDVLQTVFLRIFEGARRLDRTRSPGAYLRRAAANAAIDLLRRKKVRGESDIEDQVELPGPRLVESKPEKVLLKNRLRAALARLPRENAELFILCYLEDYSYDELAELFGIERGTVGSRLHRIRAALRQELEETKEPSDER